MSIAARAARGTAWTFTGAQATALAGLVTSIVVARAVTPEELGRYALAAAVVALLAAASSLQSGGFYVVAPEATPRMLQTGLVLELGLAASLWLLLALGTTIYASLGGDGGIAGLVVLAGAGLVLNPFADLAARFHRELAYRTPTLAQIATCLLGAAVKVSLALAGLGAWALVAGDLAAASAFAVAMLVLVPAGRRPALDRELARAQLAFGVPLLAGGFLNTLTQRVPEIVVGALLGTRELGFLYLASRIPGQVYQLGRSLSGALLPAFSRSDDRQLERGFALIARLSAVLVALPLAVAAPLATALVTTVYGERWAPAGPVLVLLFAALAIRFVFWHVGNLLKSRGRVLEMTALNAAQLALMAAGCSIGAVVGGLQGVAAGVLAVEAILVAPRLRLIRSVVPFRAGSVFRLPAGALLAGLAVAGACAALLPDAQALALSALAVAALFAGLLWRSDRAALALVLSSFRRSAHGA